MVAPSREWAWAAMGVVAVLLGAVLAAGWYSEAPDRLSAPVKAAQSSAASPALQGPQLAPMLDRAPVAPIAPEASTKGATTTPPNVVLSGVAVGVGGGNVAIVSVDQRPDMLVRVGDAMGATTTVLHIDDASLTYRFAGTEWRVFVKPQQHTDAVRPLNVAPKPLPGFAAGAPPMARPAGTEPGSGNEAFRQAIEKKIQAINAGR